LVAALIIQNAEQRMQEGSHGNTEKAST
jgi:hypothetical protein